MLPQGGDQTLKYYIGGNLRLSLFPQQRVQHACPPSAALDVLRETDCKTILTKLRTTFENAFNSEFKAPKFKKEIDVLETLNIELEHCVAKLRKENETLKQHYKDLYDSIKKTRVQTKDHTDSLIVQLNKKSTENADLKAQIQEKVFAIAALKNDLRKLKGHSVDTKFDKTSVLRKPILPSLRSQLVVRQPNAFKSEKPQMSKQRFASQVDVNNNLSKPVTQHYLPKKIVFFRWQRLINEAKKKTQERDRYSTTSVTTSARFQCTADDSKPKPRSNKSTPMSFAYI
ncbi:hypothetical protein Tco_1125458 [Tanacetum coccineum]|uniref:Uncharacterized protein n=1 Tax=Tanacetum coccineum TaxID=301880 RepID=A0ABQ5JC29_9ASTR